MTAFNRFAGFGDGGGVPEACDTRKNYRKILTDFFESELSDASVEDMKKAIKAIGKPTKVRNARHEPVDEGDGDKVIPSLDKRGHTMTDIDRGPFYKMLDRQALARQSQTGESYAVAFTKIYEAPENASIRDAATYEHLAQGEDSIQGTKLSAIPVRKAAPPDEVEDYVNASRRGDNPGPAHAELHRRVGDRMKSDPSLSYERAFTAEYLHPNNRSLKARVDAESELHARGLSPEVRPFRPYGNPGDERFSSTHRPVGREGRGGEDF
jgi:hypothetical protein